MKSENNRITREAKELLKREKLNKKYFPEEFKIASMIVLFSIVFVVLLCLLYINITKPSFTIYEEVCKNKTYEVDEINYNINKINRTILDNCSYLFGSNSNNITLGIFPDSSGNEYLANISLKNNNPLKGIEVNGIYVVAEFVDNTSIEPVKIEKNTIYRNNCYGSNLFYKVEEKILKEDLTTNWLDENCECTDCNFVYNKGITIDCKCSEYKCSDKYIVGVNK